MKRCIKVKVEENCENLHQVNYAIVASTIKTIEAR